jgi:hypothetical protein
MGTEGLVSEIDFCLTLLTTVAMNNFVRLAEVPMSGGCVIAEFLLNLCRRRAQVLSSAYRADDKLPGMPLK